MAQNIPVVVAMQYKVQNATANAFSAEFYGRLAKGEPVDVAAQNGRYRVALEADYLGNDFAAPVIFMRVENGYLFQKEEVIINIRGGLLHVLRSPRCSPLLCLAAIQQLKRW